MANENLIGAETTTFVGGQDASKVPAQVPKDSYYAGVNLNISKGVPTPPWGKRQRKLKFPSSGISDPGRRSFVSYEEIYTSGRYQCSAPYSVGSENYLLQVISGIIYLVNQRTFEVQIIPIQGGGSLNENTPRLNCEPAGRFFVIHDYPNFPVILDGITARRANPDKYEVPVSVMGAYNQSRLFIANAGNEYTAGDPAGNVATPNAPITFEEVEAPAASFLGQVFGLPTDRITPITAMGFLQFIDTNTGLGPLLISTDNTIYTVASNQPRANWDPANFATAFVLKSGIAGQRAWTNVGSDIFYIGSDGQIRTASMSRDEQKKWARIPISREVEPWLVVNDTTLVKYGVAAFHKNKIFFTVNPFRVPSLSTTRTPIYDVAHGGMVVLSTDNIATLGREGSPAWEGLWTGVRPMDIIVDPVTNRAFIMSKDEDYRNELWEFDPGITYDVSAKGEVRYSKAVLYSKAYDFELPFQDKTLHSLDFNIQNIQGDFSIEVQYKASQGTDFVLWAKREFCVPWRNCGPVSNTIANGLSPQNLNPLVMGSPVDFCAEATQQLYSRFRRVQVRIVLTGKYWELHEYKIKATKVPQSEQINFDCSEPACLELPKQCLDDWKIGAFSSCLQHKT